MRRQSANGAMDRPEGVKYRAMVKRRAPLPSPSGMIVCTEPLPNERVPTSVARLWSCSAPATISDAGAEPPSRPGDFRKPYRHSLSAICYRRFRLRTVLHGRSPSRVTSWHFPRVVVTRAYYFRLDSATASSQITSRLTSYTPHKRTRNVHNQREAKSMVRRLKVNGTMRSSPAEADTPLLYVLRNDLELNGAKFGCGLAQCGACTVLVDGRATRSCVTPIGTLGESEITTIEGLGTIEKPHPLQRAFVEEQAAQCGYCINGMIMTAKELLDRTPKPTEADVRAALDANLCRCGTHGRIIRAVLKAAELAGRI
jgi:nicotinate dehydrogenase subunit A